MKKTNNKSDFRKGGKSSRGKANTGRKNIKDQRKEDRFDEEAVKGKTRASNDPEWYGAKSALMQTAGSIPFSNVLGKPLSIGMNGQPDFSVSIPGIMKLDFAPTYGEMGSWTSAFNVMMRDSYTFIRHANSGHSNYDAADLGRYYITYDNVVMFYAEMVRIYGLMRAALVRNRYTPKSLVECLGYNYNDLASKLANFRYYINTYAARLSAMKVPSNLNIIRRHMWMVSNVYMDTPVETGQMYVFHPAAYWRNNLAATSVVDVFQCINHRSNVASWFLEDIINFGDMMLNSMLNSEDFNIMSGDIMKAYNDSVFTVNMIAEDYMVIPTFDPEILMQIHNATVLEVSDSELNDWNIYEDDSETTNVGALVFDASVKVWNNDGTGSLDFYPANLHLFLDKVLDMPIERPTPENVAVATRLMASTRTPLESLTPTTTGQSAVINVHGSEIVVSAAGYKLLGNGTLIDTKYYAQNQYGNSMEEFNAHPFRIIYTFSDGKLNVPSGTNRIAGIVIDGDKDNVGIINHDQLSDIHEAASMGLYGLIK